MKTAQEQAQFIFDDCPGVVCENRQHRNWKFRIELAFVNREKEIREDQDKITRHACAENIYKVRSDIITREAAHGIIINTKAI